MANNIEGKIKRLILAAGFGIVGLTVEESKAREAQEELKGMHSRDKQSEESTTSNRGNEIKHAGRNLTLSFGKDFPELSQEPEVAQQIDPTPIPTQVAEIFSNLEIDGSVFALNQMVALDNNASAQMRNLLNVREGVPIYEVELSADFSNLKMGLRNVEGLYYVYDTTSENPFYTLVNINDRDALLRALGAEIILPEHIPAQISVKGQVNIRENANPNGNLLTSVSQGTLEVVDSSVESNGGYEWYHVKTPNGQLGWVADTGRIEVPNDLDGTVTVYTVTFPDSAYIPTAEELERQARLAELGVDPESGVLPLFESIEKLPQKPVIAGEVSGLENQRASSNVAPKVEKEPISQPRYRGEVQKFYGALFVDSEAFQADEKKVMRLYFDFKFSNGNVLHVSVDAVKRFQASNSSTGKVSVVQVANLLRNPMKIRPDLFASFSTNTIVLYDSSPEGIAAACEGSTFTDCTENITMLIEAERLGDERSEAISIIESNGTIPYDQSHIFNLGSLIQYRGQ